MSFCHSVYKHKKHDKTIVLFVIICLSVILSLYIKFPFSMYALSVSVTYMNQEVADCVEEGPYQASRRACSWTLKGMFSNGEGHVLEGVRQGGEASVAVRFCEIG